MSVLSYPLPQILYSIGNNVTNIVIIRHITDNQVSHHFSTKTKRWKDYIYTDNTINYTLQGEIYYKRKVCVNIGV